MEIIFQREKGDRNLSFKLIGDELGFAEDDIEYLVMKAMSLGLVKGTIDQIDKVVRVSWVKPRILDMERIILMRDKLQQWQDGLEAITHMLEDKAQDLLAGQWLINSLLIHLYCFFFSSSILLFNSISYTIYYFFDTPPLKGITPSAWWFSSFPPSTKLG